MRANACTAGAGRKKRRCKNLDGRSKAPNGKDPTPAPTGGDAGSSTHVSLSQVPAVAAGGRRNRTRRTTAAALRLPTEQCTAAEREKERERGDETGRGRRV